MVAMNFRLFDTQTFFRLVVVGGLLATSYSRTRSVEAFFPTSTLTSTSKPILQHPRTPQTDTVAFKSRRLASSISSDNGDDSSTSKKISTIPGRRSSPRFLSFLFDDSIKLLSPKTMGTYQTKTARKYQSPIFKTNIFFQPTVVVTSQDYVDKIFYEESKHKGCLVPAFPPHHYKLFGPKSVIVQKGEYHARLRRLLQPSLSPVAIQSYRPLIESSVKEFVRSLQQETSQEEDRVVLVPKIRPFFISLAVQILLGTGTGSGGDDANKTSSPLSASEQEDLADELTTWSKGLLSAPLTFIPWSTSSKAMRARKRIASRLQKLIDAERSSQQQQQQQQENQPDGSGGMGLLRRMITSCDPETGEYLNDDEIIDNILTFVFAGSDTTASAATSLWLVLTLYPNVKKVVRDDPSKLETLIQKVLSVYPPAPFAMRQVQKQIQIDVDGSGSDDDGGISYVIPENWQIVYGFYGILESQRSKEGAGDNNNNDDDDVSKSQLEEWLLVDSSSSTSPPPSAFGGGPRMCPGRFLAMEELKSFGKFLVQNELEWTLDPIDQDLESKYTPGYFPVDGLSIRFQYN